METKNLLIAGVIVLVGWSLWRRGGTREHQPGGTDVALPVTPGDVALPVTPGDVADQDVAVAPPEPIPFTPRGSAAQLRQRLAELAADKEAALYRLREADRAYQTISPTDRAGMDRAFAAIQSAQEQESRIFQERLRIEASLRAEKTRARKEIARRASALPAKQRSAFFARYAGAGGATRFLEANPDF